MPGGAQTREVARCRLGRHSFIRNEVISSDVKLQNSRETARARGAASAPLVGHLLPLILTAFALAGCSGPGGRMVLSEAVVSQAPPGPSSSASHGGAPAPSPTPSSSSGAPANAAPVSSAAPAPIAPQTPAAGNGGLSPSNYANIVNGQPWPLNFRPNCANPTYQPSAPCPYNDPLPNPDNPVHVYSSSSSIISAMAGAGDLEFGFFAGEGGGGDPVYLASASDPVVTVSCMKWCQASSVAINVPSHAQAMSAICPGDCQIAVIQPDGTEYAIYGMSPNYDGGSTITAGGLAFESVVIGNGVDPNGASLAYPGNGGGNVGNGSMLAAIDDALRVNELSNGLIPHSLHMNMACGTGQVYPGSTNDQCSQFGYSGPPAGARFQLTLTDAQINALPAAAWEKVILHALHDYGAIGDVTCPRQCGDRINLYTESQTQYGAYGQTWPVSEFDWSSPSNNGGYGSVPTHWQPAGVNWSTMLRILDPCYSLETCIS